MFLFCFSSMMIVVGFASTNEIIVLNQKKEINLKTCEECEDKLAAMNQGLNEQHKKITNLELEIKSVQSLRLKEIKEPQPPLTVVRKLMDQSNRADGGVSYIRWGRTVCSASAISLYKGYVGGTMYTAKGGGSNYLCLPEKPEWGNRMDGLQREAQIQGAEYKSGYFENIFSTVNNNGKSLHCSDPPCVACFVPTRSALIMIPAKRSCPAGWTMEYRGYLVTELNEWNNKDFVCLDENPEAVPGSQHTFHGALFYAVEGKCGGSLPCPPYVEGWEIACVVCTK